MNRNLILVMSFCGALAGCDNFAPERVKPTEPEIVAVADPAPAAPQEAMIDIDLTKLSAAPNVVVSYANGLPTIVGGDSSLATAGFTEGAFFTIPPESEVAFSGKTVRIVVRAKSASEASASVGIAYSTAEVGNSGWQIFSVGAESQDVQFEFNAPPMVAGNGDYVGFYANPAVTIESVRLGIVD